MTTQQELADQIEQSCHVTIEHGLVGGTILTKDKLDTIVTALRAHDDMLAVLKEIVAAGSPSPSADASFEKRMTRARLAIAKAGSQS